ncbi:hypothetical protein [Jiangella rhizosphaerae]|uniref:Uncharacterized protein n=1 Tax=Jiangella rhizosphaerae TaxID=2293569 RepID=A0A418KU77_9ACTN|nr:hypothetical protein [Jiangella rhizosphaerae]RIQ30197.1 hypothetical protein DY240_07455 [Jiangella rhizosphaerae]
MTEPTLKDLFQRTLTGEPVRPVVAEEDVARGKARQQRMRRNRVAGGVALLAVAGVGAAVLPAVVGDDRGNVPAADAGDPDGGDYPPQVGDDPVKQRMWDAIVAALPADVEVVEFDDPAFPVVPEAGPSIDVLLTRADSGAAYSMGVSLEPTRTDLPEYRPCTEPGLLEGTMSQWQNCEEGRDDDGVYRAAGDLVDLSASVVLAENDDTSVTVRWSTRPQPLPGSDLPASGQGAQPIDPALDRAAGAAIGDAVLEAAAGLDPAGLTSGVRLDDVVAAWPELRGVLEEAVGAELTPVGGDDPAVDVQDAEHQVGTISAEYTTDDGLEVELWFWQRPRASEPMCVEQIMQCSSITGGQELLGPPEAGGSGESGVAVGLRGDTWIRVSTEDPGDERPGTVTGGVLQPLDEVLSPLVRSPAGGG